MTGMDDLVPWLVFDAVIIGYDIVMAWRLFADWLVWRKVQPYAYAPPIANLTPPTVAELRTPTWIGDHRG